MGFSRLLFLLFFLVWSACLPGWLTWLLLYLQSFSHFSLFRWRIQFSLILMRSRALPRLPFPSFSFSLTFFLSLSSVSSSKVNEEKTKGEKKEKRRRRRWRRDHNRRGKEDRKGGFSLPFFSWLNLQNLVDSLLPLPSVSLFFLLHLFFNLVLVFGLALLFSSQPSTILFRRSLLLYFCCN